MRTRRRVVSMPKRPVAPVELKTEAVISASEPVVVEKEVVIENNDVSVTAVSVETDGTTFSVVKKNEEQLVDGFTSSASESSEISKPVIEKVLKPAAKRVRTKRAK